jgi:hypothetical protein
MGVSQSVQFTIFHQNPNDVPMRISYGHFLAVVVSNLKRIPMRKSRMTWEERRMNCFMVGYHVIAATTTAKKN